MTAAAALAGVVSLVATNHLSRRTEPDGVPGANGHRLAPDTDPHASAALRGEERVRAKELRAAGILKRPWRVQAGGDGRALLNERRDGAA